MKLETETQKSQWMTQKEIRNSQWINNAWVQGDSSEYEDVINPATGELISRVWSANKSIVDEAVTAARVAYENDWKHRTPRERSELLNAFAEAVNEHLDEFIEVESLNGGKPLAAARWEYEDFVVDSLRFFAGACRNLDGIAAGDYLQGTSSFVRRESLGVAAGIVPWNYPGEQAAWKIGPALAAGNTIVIKPSEGTPLSAMKLVELAGEYFPPGVVNLVTGRGVTVGDALASHPGIDIVSITGSERGGREVAQSSAVNLTRTHLELGGNAPVIIHADANLSQAREILSDGAYFNAGQDCTAASRFIVHESRADEVAEMMKTSGEALVMGDPLGADGSSVTLGPLASEVQRERLHGLVTEAVEAGAKVISGGEPLEIPGYFYKPTVITDIRQEMEIVKEELFGPVVTIQTFSDEKEALELANDVRQGLAASVWTNDISKAMRAVTELTFGTVWINDHLPLVAELPHGGFKASGHGRDMSRHAIEDYMDVKHVMIRHS